MNVPLLTLLLAVPTLGGVLCLFMHPTNGRGVRALAFTFAFATAVAAVPLYTGFDGTSAAYQFQESHEWIPSLGATYHVGVDGISLFLVLLTVVLTPLALLASWKSVDRRVREFMAALLFLEAAMIGVFVALDLFLFYVFWEAMLIPMYLLIAVWGGPDRRYAAMKFILYTIVGSLLMLVAILYLYSASGTGSFDLPGILERAHFPLATQWWLFAAFALAFGVKVPLFPLHTWLPNAHVEAPTAGSVILAGVLLKMGVYGFLRFAIPLFPEAFVQAAPWIAVLSLVGIVYGAFLALAQNDMKKLVAYSSVSHLGFVMLGIASLRVEGVMGALYQSLNHGVSTGALFLLVGLLYERCHTRELNDYGGLASKVPLLATCWVIIALSSIGLPGMNGFVGEFLILLGTFQAPAVWAATENHVIALGPVWAVVGGLGIVLGAVYMLRLVQKLLYGTAAHDHPIADMNGREVLTLVPLVGLVFVMGLYPAFILSKMQPSVQSLLDKLPK